MSRDEIDIQRARQYAWSLKLNDEPEAASDEEPGAAETSPEAAEKDLASWRAELHEQAGALAAAVERVWNGAMSEAQQARQVEALLESAAALNLGMIAMSSEPLGPVRLARLVHRHWHRLSEKARESAVGAFMWSHFEPAPAVEMLVEICRDGNEELASLLFWPLFHGEPEDAQQSPFSATGLAEQLIALLDGADALKRPWASRLIGLEWLRLAPSRAAIPVLRRMLRMPHLEVRCRALDRLLQDYTQAALLPEDVLFMLEDRLVHAPESGPAYSGRDAPDRYSTSLHEAITTLRPTGGAELLEQLAFEGDFLRIGYQGDWEGRWALIALSAAYPERALPYIDRCLRSSSSYARLVAVEAVFELPDEPARPRLIALAADGAASLAEQARDGWIKRFTSVCPVEPLAGFPIELLSAPPSERLQDRLLCLRSPSKEARQAMVEALLAEAPDSESLALITFALCDDRLLDAPTRGRLPKDRKRMFARLYRLFGEPAIAALCWLVERYPARGIEDWLDDVDSLLATRKVRQRDLEPLRDLAARWLEAPDLKKQRRALDVLVKVGAPARLKEQLLGLVWRDEPSPYWVEQVLQKFPADSALDAHIVKAAQDAWANRELSRLSTWLSIGFGRRIRPLDRIAREILTAWQKYAAAQRAKGEPLSSPNAELPLSLAVRCVRHLHTRKKVDASTIKTWLATPEAPEFLLATHLPIAEDDTTAEQALLAALKSVASPKEVLQEAAGVLLFRNVLDPDDPRLRELLIEESSRLRFWAMHHVAFSKCRKHQAHRLTVAALLKSATVADENDLSDCLPRLVRAVGAEEVQKALAELPNQELRERLLAMAYDADAEPEYWQDGTEASR